MKNKIYKLSASLICSDILNLEKEIKIIEKAGIDQIHFDVMDGQFVPRLGLYPEMLKAVKSVTKLPVDVHLMIDDPDEYVDIFIESGADALIVHLESTRHLHRVIKKIKDKKRLAGVALNPATPLTSLDYIISDIDYVMLMAINPGIVGHKLIPGMIQKIKDLKNKLGDKKGPLIYIDGGVTPESSIEMIRSGADMLVCGTQTIFRPDAPIDKKTKELRQQLDKQLKQNAV
jgi:ribulose-phosphate 3-epimerase